MERNIGKIWLTVLIVLGMTFFFGACRNENPKNAQDIFDQAAKSAAQKDTVVDNSRIKKIRGVFYTIPSALEIGELLKESGVNYSESYPSDPTTLSKYSSQKGQAVNLGIYAADLSYAGIYEQKEEAMLYLKCANQLATSLGIPNAFGEGTISRINGNMSNRDSLLKIITEDYWNTDQYLKNNDRQEMSALIMAGGWVEGLYLATQMASHSKTNKVLINRVAEQKLSLDDLVDLINSYQDNAQGIQTIKGQLRRLQDAYAGVDVETGKADVTTNGTNNTSTLGGSERVMMTPEQFKTVTDATATVRNEIIQEY